MNIIKKIIENNDKWLDPEYCLEAVRQDGYSLKFVREQTPEICLAAVRQNGDALQYVKEQTPEICTVAIKQNSDAYNYIRLPAQEPEKSRFIKKLALLLN